MIHQPASTRYANAGLCRPCGRSGLRLPMISLGRRHNFDAVRNLAFSPAELAGIDRILAG